jgi:hypothetical protein
VLENRWKGTGGVRNTTNPLAPTTNPCCLSLPTLQAGSEEEREHAELLMDYQNRRGGRVRLAGISMPEMEFTHPEKVRHGRRGA